MSTIYGYAEVVQTMHEIFTVVHISHMTVSAEHSRKTVVHRVNPLTLTDFMRYLRLHGWPVSLEKAKGMIEAGIFEPAAIAFQKQTQERDEYGRPITVTDYAIIRAWGNYLTSQNIAHGQVYSFPQLEQVMNLPFERNDGGEPMLVALALIDSGDQTDAVYDFCARNSEWALPCKGSSKAMQSHFKISKVNKADSAAYGMQLVLVDGGKYKDMIAGRMRRENGTGSWMVFQGCDREYAEQVTSEHKVKIRTGGGRSRQEWQKKTSHADNHYLDCEVYCMAAADMLEVRMLHLRDVAPAPASASAPEQKKQPPPTPEESWINLNESWL